MSTLTLSPTIATTQPITLESILRKSQPYLSQYTYVGIRSQTVPFTLGELDHISYQWIDGEITDNPLGGVCATEIEIDYIKQIAMHCTSDERNRYRCEGFYDGLHIAIIGGYRATYGEDYGEIVIRDAIVLEILS